MPGDLKPPKVCACGISFMPRPSNYAKAIRCPECAKSRRKESGNKHQTAGVRHEQKRKARARVITEKRFIAIDGEGLGERNYMFNEYWEDGDEVYTDHRYKFAAAAYSDGTDAPDLEPELGSGRLKTNDILWWLWKVSKRCSAWFYGSKYDWTHIFRDIAIEAPEVLHKLFHPDPLYPFETVWWRGWGFCYVQGSMTLSRWVTIKDKEGNDRRVINRRFFQDGFKCWGGGSFVSVLQAWQVGTPEQIERISEMKDQRAKFEELTDEVREYCREEVRLLAVLAHKITSTFAQMGIQPKGGQWYSAGSAAKALLRVHQVNADEKTGWEGYRGPDRYAGAPEDIRDILMRSFFGGWFDLFETGIFTELHSIDLASAYPAVIRDLPCLSHGEWKREFVPGALNWGHITWEPNHVGDSRVGPFPWRFPDGRTYRPTMGEGWYCEDLIRAAQKLGSYDIDEIEWVAFVPGCDHRPFSWVQETYDLRLQLGKDGAGLALKVSLNSVYGTFADTLSLDSPYASIPWASMITGKTQAKILNIIVEHEADVVGVATDGILAKKPIVTTEKRKILGEWDYDGELHDVLLIQPGLYLAAEGPDPKKQFRNRGHALRDIRDLEPELREAWLRDGWEATVSYERTRLIPAKLALARKEPLKVYGQWFTEPVKIAFKPASRVPLPDPGPRKRSVAPLTHLLDPRIAGTERELSAPYNRLLALQLYQNLIDMRELNDAQP